MNAPLKSQTRSAWLFGRKTDLWVFVAPAVAAVLLVAAAQALRIIDEDTPPLLWLIAVLGVDVAHVWSTLYRTYSDPEELRRRPALYAGAPIAVYIAGISIYRLGGPSLFWRVLAYTAVFHFIRQQYGWLALYRRRAGETDRLGKRIDGAAIYLATLAPLIWWHAAPPRQFHWFLEGDFAIGLPHWTGSAALSLESLALVAYVIHAGVSARSAALIPWGKHLLVLSTAICWWLGIVAFDSDIVFTVTNVLIHGIPYMALIWRTGARRYRGEAGLVGGLFALGWPAIYLVVVSLAFAEEGLWDNLVWHDHPALFGDFSLRLAADRLAWLVPLLALPQGVHYVLDGFIWRAGPKNPSWRPDSSLADIG